MRVFVAACMLSAPAAFGAGSVIAWGNNSDLQCQVPGGLTSVASLAAGDSHSLALKSDGTVAAWGLNVVGQATVPASLSNVRAIAARGLHSMALRSNGTVVAWGDYPVLPSGLSNVVAIAAGNDHSVALKQNGSLVVWGQPDITPPAITNAIAIAAGDGHSLALLADGTLVGWGTNEFLLEGVPTGATNVAAIAAGTDHCLALRRDGTVLAWGSNSKGQLNVPPGLANVVAITAGTGHSLVAKADGTLAAWGDNTFGQTNVNPAPPGFIAVASGGGHNLAIRGDGKPVITVQPASQSVGISRSATLNVIATGNATLGYQWQHNGTNVPGATNTLLTLANVQMSDGGIYAVMVSNSLGSMRSADALLTPIGIPPLITVNPQDQSTRCGDSAQFRVTVEGSTPLSYAWYFEGAAIADATSTLLVLTNIAPNQAGSYLVVVTNAFGAVTSTPAALTVLIDADDHQPPER